MSFRICLQCFEDGDFSVFKRSIVWDIFGKSSHLTNEGWGLVYSNRNGGCLNLYDDEFINGFSINRPSDDALRDLYAVAQRVPCAINWDSNFAVADATFIAGMPDWLLNVLPKPPMVVHSGDELIQCIARS